jgi:hypothetical protein
MSGAAGEPPGHPATVLALAARDFVRAIDHPVTLNSLETTAILGGWVGAREAGCWDVRVCDSISKAALAAVIELLRKWAAECDEAPHVPVDR